VEQQRTEAQRLERISQEIIGACIEVHRHLGPGLLESTYSECVCDEFVRRGIAYRREVFVPLSYKGKRLNTGYKIDLLVEDSVVVELKAVAKLDRNIHVAQLLTYLKVTDLKWGLLINFCAPLLKDGIRRVIRIPR
jgi:GxxExxY protein